MDFLRNRATLAGRDTRQPLKTSISRQTHQGQDPPPRTPFNPSQSRHITAYHGIPSQSFLIQIPIGQVVCCGKCRAVALEPRFLLRQWSSRSRSGRTVALEQSYTLRLTCVSRRNVPLRIRALRSGRRRRAVAVARELMSTSQLTCVGRCNHRYSIGKRIRRSRRAPAIRFERSCTLRLTCVGRCNPR